MSPLVAVIILNYNGIDDTRRAIRCVQQVGKVAVWPIVIDNGSDVDEGATIRAEFPGVHVERLEENVGFARGVNHAAKRAIRGGATHILLMNSDAWVEDGDSVLLHLLDILQGNLGIAAVGPLIVDDSEETRLQSAGYLYSFWWPIPRANLQVDRIRRCFFASGSFLLANAECFAKMGGLDPDFFLYGEDLDFAARCRAAGFSVVVTPLVKVRHRRGASSRFLSNRYIYTALRGNLINIRKHAEWYQMPSCALASVAISVVLIFLGASSGNYRAVEAVSAAWRDFFTFRWGGLRDGFVLSSADRLSATDLWNASRERL